MGLGGHLLHRTGYADLSAGVVSRRHGLGDAEMTTVRALGSETRTKDPIHLRVQFVLREMVWMEMLHAASMPAHPASRQRPPKGTAIACGQ
jgi:hypothetical protein